MITSLEKSTRYKLKVQNKMARNWLYSAYDLELRLGKNRAEIGRFSYDLINRIKFLPNPDDDLVIKIGAFCEIANSRIIVGGEHLNENLFNYTFSSGQLFKSFVPESDQKFVRVKAGGLTTIGNNVIISEGVVVTSGAEIGDGCIIGALALARGKLAPYGIYGGIPAKRLRERFNPAMLSLYQSLRMQDIAAHCIPLLPRLLHDLQTGEITVGEFEQRVDFLPERPKVVAEIAKDADGCIAIVKPIAFSVGNKSVSDEQHELLIRYFSQVPNSDNEITWTSDVFFLLNIYN